MKRPSTLLLLLSGSLVAAGCAAPRITAPREASVYYPAASLRLGEVGRVVLHFSVDENGKVVMPMRHDPVFITDQGSRAANGELRLLEAAQKYLRDATFRPRALRKRELTASIVFEIKPCGTIRHAERYDYAINLCRDQPPRPDVPMS